MTIRFASLRERDDVKSILSCVVTADIGRSFSTRVFRGHEVSSHWQKANMQLVSSSNLFAVDYDSWQATLTIEFHSGGVYEYYSVPHSVYAGLISADSHGRYFHKHIKGCYNYQRIQ